MRTALSGSTREWSLSHATFVDPVSLTQQSSKDEADINTIVKRFLKTGVLPQGAENPRYIEFNEVFDFQTAMNAVVAAERSFMAMPAEVRERFGNNPAKFVEFCSDKENLPEMRKLGLAITPEEVKELPPMKVEIVGGKLEDTTTAVPPK